MTVQNLIDILNRVENKSILIDFDSEIMGDLQSVFLYDDGKIEEIILSDSKIIPDNCKVLR